MEFSKKPIFNVSFVDFLFNFLIVFVVIAVIAVLHINPPAKEEDSPRKAELMVVLEWDDNSENDIDLWLFGSTMENELFFMNRNVPPFLLDRDDVGRESDTIAIPGGGVKTIRMNREVLTMRGWPADGEYFINIHFYSDRHKPTETVTITTSLLNPYRVIDKQTVTFYNKWQEIPVVAIRITDDKITKVSQKHNFYFAGRKLGKNAGAPP